MDHVTLSWIAPEHDGGSPILGYVVEKRDSTMNMWSQAAKVDKDTFTMKVTNLFEGRSYLFRVAAENQCGVGAYVELKQPVTAKVPYGTSFFGHLGIFTCPYINIVFISVSCFRLESNVIIFFSHFDAAR